MTKAIQLYPWDLLHSSGKRALVGDYAAHVALYKSEEGWPAPPTAEEVSGVGQTGPSPTAVSLSDEEVFTKDEIDEQIAGAVADAIVAERQRGSADHEGEMAAMRESFSEQMAAVNAKHAQDLDEARARGFEEGKAAAAEEAKAAAKAAKGGK